MNLEKAKKWVRKPENDIKVARDKLNTENPVTDALCSKIDKDFEKLMDEKVVRLTIYAVDARYPEAIDYEPSLDEAKEAIEIAEKVKDFVLKKLP